MQEWSSFWWPDADIEAKRGIVADAMMNMGSFVAHVPGRRLAVQAGGNVGVYPLALAKLFHTVHTFEPEPDNYACLLANIERHKRSGRIIPSNAALGETDASCSLALSNARNTGTWAISGPGETPMQAIDSLDLAECDLIWLDVEGYEVKALRGAAKTIDRHRPIVIVEDNGLVTKDEETGAAIEWLRDRGYRKVVKHGRDVLFAPNPEGNQ